jgi:class 3 adenylate cyclase/DNA-binding MarR family transcriptional regulator
MDQPARTVRRHLAAIFNADVAGYARLMNIDEAGTLRLLGFHRGITDRLIVQHGGRIANTAGDSILAEFPSTIDALQCGLGIQERISAVNYEIAEERRVLFRIGVHVGEVLVKSGDLFGDAVNIAARMQSLAQPGSVCISGAAHEYVRTALPLDFEDIGAQRVKNIEMPIRAYLAWPSGQPRLQALPPVHRSAEAHLARRFHALCDAAMREVTEPENLEPVEFAAIASINDASGLDPDRLAERMGIDLSTARRTVGRLECRGFVEGQLKPGSGRSGVFVTPAGESVLQRLGPAILAAQDRVMAPLSDREREMLIDLLTRVIKVGISDAGEGGNDEGRPSPK